MDRQEKLDIFYEVAKRLIESGATWAVGGSLMQYFYGITDEFADVDLMIARQSVRAARSVLNAMGTSLPAQSGPRYRSGDFFRYSVKGLSFDCIVDFTICVGERRWMFPLRLDEISFVAWRGLRLPLNEARVWEKCYALMGRPQKAKHIAVSLLARREEK